MGQHPLKNNFPVVERVLTWDRGWDKCPKKRRLSHPKQQVRQKQIVPPLVPPQKLVLNWKVPLMGQIQNNPTRARTRRKESIWKLITTNQCIRIGADHVACTLRTLSMFQRSVALEAGPVAMKWIPNWKKPSFFRRNNVARQHPNSLQASFVFSQRPEGSS